jgi:hypothetical protein
VAEEVADDLERHATLQQVHSLCVPAMSPTTLPALCALPDYVL